jgi:hypothetical protein
MKTEKIVLTDLRDINFDDNAFKVKKMTNTIDYKIGEYLSRTQVKNLLETNPKSRNITVDIVAR